MSYLNPTNLRSRSTSDLRVHPNSYDMYTHPFFQSPNVRMLVSHAQQVADNLDMIDTTIDPQFIRSLLKGVYLREAGKYVPKVRSVQLMPNTTDLAFFTGSSPTSGQIPSLRILNETMKSEIKSNLEAQAQQQNAYDLTKMQNINMGSRASVHRSQGTVISRPKQISNARLLNTETIFPRNLVMKNQFIL